MTEQESQKVDAGIANLMAQTAQLNAQTAKLQTETRWYLLVVGAVLFGTASAFSKLFL